MFFRGFIFKPFISGGGCGCGSYHKKRDLDSFRCFEALLVFFGIIKSQKHKKLKIASVTKSKNSL